jgi:phosphoribosyl-AMP cyclohydrolase
MSNQALEEGTQLQLDFRKLAKVAATGHEVVPVVVQDAHSGEVLILAYANEKALRHTLETGLATFWSTSRNELWIKGKTSGDTLRLAEVRVNCEQNSLLYRVTLDGAGSCHTKGADGRARLGCYYRRLLPDGTLEPAAQPAGRADGSCC